MCVFTWWCMAGGASARTAVFVRLDLLPFVDNVVTCSVGAMTLAPSTSSVDSIHATPTKSFSSIVKEKLSAVKV